MSYPPRHGMPPRHPMFMGVPPPNFQSGPPPPGNPPPLFFNNVPPPPPGRGKHNIGGPPPPPHIIQAKPSLNLLPSDHPSPFPHSGPSGPPVTVFVGNITDKWPDAMIRQLLSTCGYVLNWKRVQGASGKLQGFGFCEFGGPDAGLRAVRLLHDLEVGDKKLVVKVDAKTNTIFDEYKAERKKNCAYRNVESNNDEEYMDEEMKDGDERSKMRIGILFREFKDEIESFLPPGTEKPEKDPAAKQAIQDKLHLLKLTSLDAPLCDAETGDDAAVEEGKREIISQEIVKFREHMKIEKEKEEERKKLSKERRERLLERENAEKSRRERDSEVIHSPGRKRDRDVRPRSRSQSRHSDTRARSRSRQNDFGSGNNRDRDRRDRRGRSRDREERTDRVARDRDRERERDWGDRGAGRRRSRERRSRSRVSRDRSPAVAPYKRRYREREEEEEAEEQRKQDKKAREKAAAYDERLRLWEQREEKKRRDRVKDKERQERILEQIAKEARNMKEFLEDYEDEQLDSKFYKGKEFQKRLSDRTKELESDNRDRQREREEIEEMRLKVLTSGGVIPGTGVIPVITLDRQVKKPMLDSTNTSHSPSQPPPLSKKSLGSGSVQSRLQALAGQPIATTPPQISQNNGITYQPKVTERKLSATAQVQPPLQTTFPVGQFGSLAKTSNPSTPNSLVSPSAGQVMEMSPSIRSLANTGFTVVANTNSSDLKDEDEGTRNSSYSPGNSPGASSVNYDRDVDDSSLQEMSPDFQKKKKINVKDVFNQDEEDDAFGSKKRKLVPLDYGELNKGKKDPGGTAAVVDDKKKSIKSLIDRIPTEKDALFAYGIDWTMVDNVLMEKRIRPWINKKIVEYIGEPEPTLVDFICTKVLSKSNPATILDDVQMVLDDEAEVFVVKMWRLLVYEIEAKKIGLATASKA